MKKKIVIVLFLSLMFIPFSNVFASQCSLPQCQNVKNCMPCGDTCYWDKEIKACIDLTESEKVSCGNITGIPKKIPELTSYFVTIIQVAVPVILIVMGSIDLFKGITSQKEDEIKKGQQTFVKRLIVAALVFFVVVVVKFIVSLVADSTSSDNISNCIDCFLDGDCK